LAKIVLIRVDAIGDALVTTPLIAALHKAGHELGVVLSNSNAGIFEAGALAWQHVLDRIAWPKHGSTATSYARTLTEMRRIGYDTALIASEEPEAYALAREASIPARIGFHNGWQKPFKSLWISAQCTRTIFRPAWASQAREHEVETLYKLGAGFVVPPPPRDRALLASLLLANPPERGPAVVVQVTPKWRESGVSDAAMVEMLRALASNNLHAVAADAEKDYATAIAAQAPLALETFASLEPWKRAIAGAALVVTPDTGSAHLAGMLGTPCVDCFPFADFALRSKRWSPWAATYVPLAFAAGTDAASIASRIVAATREVSRLAA